MKRTILTSLLFVAALALLGCAEANSSTQTAALTPTALDHDLAELAKYRQWTLVNPKPELMEPQSARDCAINPGRQESSPHLRKYISVFVNPVGREQMLTTDQPPKFPAGSMIVKEKLGSRDSTTPEVLTVMIKRKPGYNPESGDWEYLVLDGAATKIVEQGKLTRCSSCHNYYKHSDFVTRTYLPRQ